MKLWLFSSVFLMFSQAHADEWVNGFFRRNGAYVQGYWRTDRDDTKWNNYSTEGNVNPYTGRPGYIQPDLDDGLSWGLIDDGFED